MDLETTWQEIDISYRDKVYGLFHSMKIGEVKELSDLVAPVNLTKFSLVTKYFIKWDEGRGAGFMIELNNDYSKIRKLCYAPASFPPLSPPQPPTQPLYPKAVETPQDQR